MSKARPPDYLECEQTLSVRRRMLLACIVCLVGALSFVVACELWHVLMALMVVHAMVR
jgi:hypothetical protein